MHRYLSLFVVLMLPFYCSVCFGSPIPLNSAVATEPTDWIVDGASDLRYRTASTGTTRQLYINAVELDLQHPLVISNKQQGTIYLQVIGENPPDLPSRAPASNVQLGSAYITFHLPILTETDSGAYIKVGQFVLPFGLLSTYDTHLQILQSLYPEAIGERLDWGAGVEGRFYGVVDYRGAITSGTGPNHLVADPNAVLTFRLGRIFVTPQGDFNVGGSLLSGRLPVTAVNPFTDLPPMLAPSGHVIATYGYVQKSRIGADGQWTYKSATARAEAITGADGGNRTQGYFVEGDYAFAPGLAGVISRKYWDFGIADSSIEDNAIGLNISFGNNLVVRTLYEDQSNIPVPQSGPPAGNAPSNHVRNLWTIQMLTRF